MLLLVFIWKRHFLLLTSDMTSRYHCLLFVRIIFFIFLRNICLFFIKRYLFVLSKIKKSIPNRQRYNCFWKNNFFFVLFMKFPFLHIFPPRLLISIFIKNRFPRNNYYLFCRVCSWQGACFLLCLQLPSTYILSG